jgi:hypothetical protein
VKRARIDSPRCVREDCTWGDAATCREGHILECTRRAGAPGTNETSDWISSCAKGLALLSCDGKFPAACESPAGQLADDSPCLFSSQCRGRLCSKIDDPELCGRCRTVVTEGDGCVRNQDCLPPLLCQGGECLSQPLRGEGETCNGVALQCRYPLVCFGRAGSGGGDGTCAPRLQLGATCPLSDEIDDPCDTEKGLLCDPLTKTCRPFTPLPGLGQACLEGTCSGSGTCDGSKCSPRARVGESCQTKLCLEPALCADNVDKKSRECLVVQPSGCK